MLLQNYVNTKRTSNIKLKANLDDGGVMELMKRKIQKKKEKLKPNILNFSNPFNQKFPTYKIQLETSTNNNSKIVLKILENNEFNNHKRSISNNNNNQNDSEECNTTRKDIKPKVKSSGLENAFQKYYDVYEKKDTTGSSGKIAQSEITLDKNKVIASNYLTHKNFANFKISSNIKKEESVIKPKGESKTTINTKPSTRKNSIEKNTLPNNHKNLFLLNSSKQGTLKVSGNTSINNTLLAGKISHIVLNEEPLSASKKKTINSHHSKVNSDVPLNILNSKYLSSTKNFVNAGNYIINSTSKEKTQKMVSNKISTANLKDNTSIERKDLKGNKKLGPVSITSVTSKNHSKANSKSASRIEEIYISDNKHISSNSNLLASSKYIVKKDSSLSKKAIPVTTTSSPTHSNLLTKELIGVVKKDDSKKPKEKISLKICLDMNNLKKLELVNTEKCSKNDNSFDDIFNNSNNESMISTMRESNYYKKEAEKVISYIKKCKYLLIILDFSQNLEYPSTNPKFYKYGRVNSF
jgi:hypothetical protein